MSKKMNKKGGATGRTKVKLPYAVRREKGILNRGSIRAKARRIGRQHKGHRIGGPIQRCSVCYASIVTKDHK